MSSKQENHELHQIIYFQRIINYFWVWTILQGRGGTLVSLQWYPMYILQYIGECRKATRMHYMPEIQIQCNMFPYLHEIRNSYKIINYLKIFESSINHIKVVERQTYSCSVQTQNNSYNSLSMYWFTINTGQSLKYYQAENKAQIEFSRSA